MIPRDLAAAIEAGTPVTIDLATGTWQPGRGPVVDAPESIKPREREPRLTPMARTFEALWRWWP